MSKKDVTRATQVPPEPPKPPPTVDPTERKRQQLRQNQIQGRAAEKKQKKRLEELGDTPIAEQVTLETPVTGVRTRIDFLSKGSNGKVKLTEVKSSQTAPLTSNQQKAFPEIEQSGATVVGKGKPPFVGGTKIPPTKVNVVRPDPEGVV